ncbi:uncharacterized protein LOC133446278 [Cololabis saira]|uniref:uncharacterized protein LOC133446278 n=1 Tax=Cololabis saira TaxID=129043 RepID=UPI002AD3D6FA|nr:uncharacterized protein LOC133446278 [Cololabis saira]
MGKGEARESVCPAVTCETLQYAQPMDRCGKRCDTPDWKQAAAGPAPAHLFVHLRSQLAPPAEDVISLTSMEMSPKLVSSVLLTWCVSLMFLLTSTTLTVSSAPTTGPTRLLFDSGTSGYNLRNCSCSAAIQDCNEALANSLCRCHSVPRSSLHRHGLREPGHLDIWVKDPWILEELLNGSTVEHLRLSFCGKKPLQSQQLTLLGLRTLQVHSTTPEVQHPNKEVVVFPSAGLADVPFQVSSFYHVTILDVEVLNGLSALKAYSVLGPAAPALPQVLPHLSWSFNELSSAALEGSLGAGEKALEPQPQLLITFVY